MKNKIVPYFPAVLVLFHIIGIFLFTQSNTASNLTWVNLTLCAALVLITEKFNAKTLLTFFIITIGGFVIELIGTKTGLLFGNYAYGEVLGWKLFGVSVVIGINWYAIVLASSNIARLFKLNLFLQALIGGALCVGVDFLIEPVAVKFGFWSWEGNIIPVFNYITWFVFAVFFSYLYLKWSHKLNKTAIWLFFVWIAFFLILSFI
jgi:putative membrane protein